MGSSRRTRSSLLHVFSFTQILILFFSYSFFYKPHPINTLEIIIGGEEAPPPYGDDCPDCSPPPDPPICPEPIPPPPPPPEECPPPPPPNHPPPPPPNPPPPPPPNHPPPPPPNHPPPPPPNHPPPPPPVPAPKPPPPPPPTPTPLPPELAAALKVIQRFGNTITADPQGVTKTWHGPICKDPKAYRGFKCDTTISDNKLRVALVNFNGFNLNGNPLALTNFLEGLTDLIVFHANSNNFFGQVPAGINKIPSLYEFDLSNNKLAGEFPKSVLTATNLTFLDLRFNRLTGKLPPQVFTLDLDVLYLNNNQFTGNIPENIGKTPVLYLTLANNQLTGQIPKSIGQASGPLREALLLNNKLSGCLPYEIGKLKSATVFDVSVNGLTGPIPHSFGCLENMGYLNLSYNKFYGAVPENLCGLSRLVEVTLTSNYFTQVGPKCRRLIAEGKLDVIKNCILDLPSQRSAAECAAFFLKQQSCPDPQSLNIVPCKIGNSAEPRAAAGGRKLMGPPRSYAALRRPGPE